MEPGDAIALARWVFFGAATLAFGAALFPLYAFGRGDEPGEGGSDARLVFRGALLALLAGVVWLALAIVEFGAEDSSGFLATAEIVLFRTGFGPVWLVRLAAALALLVAARCWPRPWLLLILAAVVLGSEAWIGHAATGGAIRRLLQAAHLLSAGAWLGGLVPLARILREGARSPEATMRARRVVQRFSAMGLIAVSVIALSGVVISWQAIGWPPDPARDYDRLVALKIGLFLAMVGAAVFNRFRLLPALSAPASSGAGALRHFWWTVVLEEGLGVLLLLTASLLGMTSPSGEAVGLGPYSSGSVVKRSG